MNGRKNDDWLIGKLLEETYQSLPEGELSKSPDDLLQYFDAHQNKSAPDSRDHLLTGYLKGQGIVFSSLSFNRRSGCFRAAIGDTCLDIPSNWGVFSSIEVDRAENQLIQIKKAEDSLGLCEVLSSLIPYDSDMVILTHHGRNYLVLTREGEERDVSWLLKYLGLSENSQQTKAAA